MRKGTWIVIVLALALFFMAPVVSAASPGGVIGGDIHYTQSLSCYFLGPWRGLALGDYYFEGTLGVGCTPLVV